MIDETLTVLTEIPSSSERLEPETSLLFLGAGPVSLITALAILREMGPNSPSMTFVDMRNPESEVWKTCKGCAARVLEQTMRTIAQSFDPKGEILHVKEDSATVSSGETGQILAPNVISKMAIHLPGQVDGAFAVAQLTHNELGYMTYRHNGPRELFDLKERQEIGFNHALWQLLEHNFRNATSKGQQKLTFIEGHVTQVDLGEDKPTVQVRRTLDGTVETVSADLVVSAMGVYGGKVPVVGRQSQLREQVVPDMVKAAVREIVISPRKAEAIYGPGFNRGHMFILDPRGGGKDIQYAMLLPQWVMGDKKRKIPVVTLVMIAREGSEITSASQFKKVQQSLKPYLPIPEKEEGIEMSEGVCGCLTAIPVSNVPLETTYDRGYLVMGDTTGVLRLLKNGIGTGVDMAIRAASFLVEKGYSKAVLKEIATSIYDMYVTDNQVGEKLLNWLNELVINNRVLSKVVYLFTLVEQHFPQQYQVILRAMTDLTSGAKSYQDIVNDLFSLGGRGNIYTRGISEIICLIANILGKPPPLRLR